MIIPPSSIRSSYHPYVEGPPAAADRGFEQVSVGAGEFAYAPAGSPWWSFTPQDGNNGSGIAANGSGFGNPTAPQGSQVAFLQGSSTISESVTGWAPGIYQLSFSAAQRGANQQSQDFEVMVDTTVVGKFTPSGTTYQTYTTPVFDVDPFVIGPGSHTITFLGLDTAQGDNTVFIDDVTLTRLAAVADQGFEQVSVGADHYEPDPNGSPWSFSGTAGIVANGSSFITGNPSAPQGTQVAYLTNDRLDQPGRPRLDPRHLRAERDSRPTGTRTSRHRPSRC